MEKPSDTLSILVLILLLTSLGCESRPSAPETAAPSPPPPSESGTDLTRPADEVPAQAAPVPGFSDDGFRRVYSLVENRHALHLYDTGLLVDFGAPSAYKYTQGRWRGSWQAGREEAGRPVAYTDGIGATFRFPLVAVDSDFELVLRMRAVGDDQRMDVFLNGDEPLPTVTGLPDAWGVVRVRLPQTRLVPGENQIRLHFRRSIRSSELGRTAGGFDFARLRPIEAEAGPEEGPAAFPRVPLVFTPVVGPNWAALHAPQYGTLAAYLTVPEGARLRLRLASEPTLQTAAAHIVIRSDDTAPATLWEGTVTNDPVSIEADLSAYANEVVRLELTGDGPVQSGNLFWIDPHLAVEERPVTSPATEGPQHVLIWLIDTLRADHFDVYNPSTPVQTPNLTEFAEQCVVFERASVQGNSSLPASASIHTGTYPTVHGIVSSSANIGRDMPVLGEAFETAGFATALFSSNGYVSESRGFGRGYDAYRNLIHEPGRPDSEYLWPLANDWLTERLEAGPEERWFVYLNTIDPHVPYDPPTELLQRYHPEPYAGRIRPRATGSCSTAWASAASATRTSLSSSPCTMARSPIMTGGSAKCCRPCRRKSDSTTP